MSILASFTGYRPEALPLCSPVCGGLYSGHFIHRWRSAVFRQWSERKALLILHGKQAQNEEVRAIPLRCANAAGKLAVRA